MTRLYLKIFFTFWLITVAIIIGTNIVVHWFDMTPDGNLQRSSEANDDDPAKRLLFQMVGNAVNRNTRQLIQDLACGFRFENLLHENHCYLTISNLFHRLQ